MPRLAIAQLRPTKGDYGANLQKIGGVLAQIAKLDPPADLVVFPETATSGYFVEGGVRDVAVTAGTLFRDLGLQHEAAQAPPMDVAVGFYEVFQNRFYNSCLYASLGNASPRSASPRGTPGIRHIHRKLFLPTYGVFDEERFVERGPGRPNRAARSAVRGGGAHLRHRSRRADAGKSRRSVAGRLGGESPASRQEPRDAGCGKREA